MLVLAVPKASYHMSSMPCEYGKVITCNNSRLGSVFLSPELDLYQKRHMNNTPSSHNMQELMNGSSFEEWIAIAEYISTCESIRKHYLESLE